MARRPLMATLLAAALMLAAGCAADAPAVNPANDAATQQVDLNRVPQLDLSPSWERSFAGPVAVSVAPDGLRAAVVAADGLHVLDARGGEVWSSPQTARATALPGGLVVQGSTLFDAHGAALWRAPSGGSLRAVATPSGNRIAIIDDEAGQIVLLGPGAQTIAQYSVAAGAVARLSDAGSLLVDDGRRVFLVGPDGGTGPSFRTGSDAPRRHLALAHGGSWIALTTGGGDDSTYVFSTDGNLVWRRPAPAGGPAALAIAPDDRTIAVYNPGSAGVVGLDATDGHAVWRLLLGASVDGFAFLPDGRAMIDASAGPSRVLAVLRPDGSVSGQQSFGADRLVLEGPAGVAASVSLSGGTATLRWYILARRA